MPTSIARFLLCSAVIAFALPDRAAAQAPTEPAPAPPKGSVGGQAAASKGVTELDDGKFASISTSEAMDATEAEVSAGGLFTSGNARAGAFTGGARLRIRRKIHEFGAQFVGNYGQAGIRQPDGSIKGQTTVGNVQGRLRYDVFFHSRVSFFAMVTARHDPFLGLDLRLRIDPGFAFYIINQPKHRLWAEVGYDFLLDVRRIAEGADNSACPVGAGYVLDIPNTDPLMPRCAARPRLATHSARIFAGYSNSLSDRVTFATGIEYIQAFAPFRSLPEESVNAVTRIKSWVNWDVSLTTALFKNFAFATTFTLRYDNAALPGVQRLDTITSFNLVYRFI
jgi:putative salt-induced outer membrane protein